MNLGRIVIISLAVTPLVASFSRAWEGVSFADCHRRLELAPKSPEGPYCFYRVGLFQDRLPEARKHLTALLESNQDHPELLLALGQSQDNRPAKVELYRKSLASFVAAGDLSGELRVRQALWWNLWKLGRLDAAARQIEEATRLRDEVSDPLILAKIDLFEAWSIFNQSHDFSAALQLIEGHEDLLTAEPLDYRTRQRTLMLLGQINFELGRSDKAYSYFQREEELAALQGDLRDQANALSNLLIVFRDTLEDAAMSEREEAIGFVENLLAKLEILDIREHLPTAYLALGDLRRDEQSIVLYELCIEIAFEMESWDDFKKCSFTLAEQIAATDSKRALELVEQIWRVAPAAESPVQAVLDAQNEMRVLWGTHDIEKAWRASQRVFAAVDNLRSIQPDRFSRASSFSSWAPTYPWVAGRLLVDFKQTGDSKSLGRAFQVVEQMRSRVLLEILETGRVSLATGPAVEKARGNLKEVMAQLASLQRDLRVGNISSVNQSLAVERAEALHRRSQALRSEIARHSGRFSDLEEPDFATLRSVQEALTEGEAFLSFQLAPWESPFEAMAGGAWVIVITKETADAFPLHEGVEVTDRISVLSGLLNQERDSRRLSLRLFEDLMVQAVESLPPAVTDLIISPDHSLHRIPLALLLHETEWSGRFHFSRVPSATLWLRRWREQHPTQIGVHALVLVNPETGSESSSMEAREHYQPPRSFGPLVKGLNEVLANDGYGTLPFAEVEGWSVRRYLGRMADVRSGREATEALLRSKGLNEYRLLHFAAHAIASDEDPSSAGVLLTPDPETDGHSTLNDGILRFDEIVDLECADCVVVLSTCHSARGQILRGEGVFDLARAFFEGGARAVVGSLWRLEDRATARFFDDFYRHLAHGTSLSEALHLAQRDQIASGAPPSAWAGIVVIGDGSLVPFPDPGVRHHPGWPIALALILLAVAASVASRRSG